MFLQSIALVNKLDISYIYADEMALLQKRDGHAKSTDSDVENVCGNPDVKTE